MSTALRALLDTNVVIGLLKADEIATKLVADAGLTFAEMAVSQITRMELLSFENLTAPELHTVEAFLRELQVIGIDAAVESAAIKLRRSRTLKLPDAIIAGTALSRNLLLLTLDQALAKVVAEQPS
jgi:predicted nucleic acid-binding protein